MRPRTEYASHESGVFAPTVSGRMPTVVADAPAVTMKARETTLRHLMTEP
jgi:hypothetical protein